MKILSLGAAGFIGSHLTHRLLQEGHRVTALDLDVEKVTDCLEHPNLKFLQQDIRSPLDFEQMAKIVRPEDFEGRMLISSDLEQHRVQIQRYLDLGFDQIYLHNVGRNQTEWIETFGREVLPKLTA